MRRPSFLLGGLLGALLSLPVIAFSYLGNQLADLPFIPFDLFDWLARVLPGHLITLGIDTMVAFITAMGLGPISDVAKSLEHLQGILIVIAGSAALGVIQVLLVRRTAWAGSRLGALVGGVAFLIFAIIEIRLGLLASPSAAGALVWLAVLIVGVNIGLGMWLAGEPFFNIIPAEEPEARLSRRMVLKFAGVSLGAAVLAWGAGGLLTLQRRVSGAGQPLSVGGGPGTSVVPAAETPATLTAPQAAETATVAAAAQNRIVPAPGARPEVTPDALFYRIDIDASPPFIQEKDWSLHVGGLFDRPRTLTLSDLMAYPAVTQPITLSCISNPVGGDLISTGYWTGVSLPTLLKDLGLRPEAKALSIGSEDDYYETVTMTDMLDPRTLMVYGMNGATLAQKHGFPLRIYIPNRYGMKQPKWITSMDATAQEGSGYWVDRGWSASARPQIVSVIDVVAKDQIKDGLVPVGGIAWAGDHGIQKVEVQVDQGAWTPAVLRVPPLSPLTWVQWRYDWPVQKGRHDFRVRATDGAGTLQTENEAGSYPDGATGYDSVTETL